MTDYYKKRLAVIVEALRYTGMDRSAGDLQSIMLNMERLNNYLTVKYNGEPIQAICQFDGGECDKEATCLCVANADNPYAAKRFYSVCDFHAARDVMGNGGWHVEPLPVTWGSKQQEPTHQHIRYIEI